MFQRVMPRILIVLAILVYCGVSVADETVAKGPQQRRAQPQPTYHRAPSGSGAEAGIHQWIGSPGIGLFIDPTLFLIDAELEYVIKPHFYLGPIVQLGVGSGTLFTVSGAGRLIFGNHPKIKPSAQFGLGLAAQSPGGGGLHIMFGVGVDYKIDSGIYLGTMVRGNIMIGGATLKSFAVSWPLLLVRFAL